MTVGQRFARLVTDVVVRVPFALAALPRAADARVRPARPVWDATRVEPPSGSLRCSRRSSRCPTPPARALDLGTGTGAVARRGRRALAGAEVSASTSSAGMVAEARRLGERERYEVADASALPFADGASTSSR